MSSVRTFVSPRVALVLFLSLSLSEYCFAQGGSLVEADSSQETVLETMVVKGTLLDTSSEQSKSYIFDKSKGATRLDISTQETPQTVNTITRQQMNDFGLSDAKDLLSATPGVVVQRVETDRTVYSSRGSEISNFQTDGLGVPFGDYNYQNGDIDTYIYDRIEVIKGANGLTSSLGDPGASVNFVRKRPTRVFQAAGGLSYGSWDTSRVEGDLSGALTGSGSVRARVIGAGEKGNSYLDHYSSQKSIFSGIIEADLSANTLLTIGHFQQDSQPEGNNWGALPLLDQNGSQLHYDRSYNPVPNWAKWDKNNQNSFVEIKQKFSDGWVLNATFQYVKADEDAALMYYFGAPDNLGRGVSTFPALYKTKQTQRMADVNISGSYNLFGQDHEIVYGTSWSKNEERQKSGDSAFYPEIDWNNWSGQFAKPDFTFTGADASGANYHQEINNVYAATRLHLTNDMRLLLGANITSAESTGNSYGSAVNYDKSRAMPYAGLTYNFGPQYTAYTSYSTIYRPQTALDTSGKIIDPVEGEAYEVGAKGSWFDDRLTSSFALFQTGQDHYPVRASDSASIIKRYEVGNLKTQGYEWNLAGRVAERTDLILGFTHVKMKDTKTGNETRTYLPSRLFSLLTTHQLAFLPALKVGAGLTWQSRVYQDVESSASVGGVSVPFVGRIRQGDYALLNLMTSYDLSKNIAMQVNAGNVTNKKYLNSFPDGQGYYGAPSHYTVGVNFKN